MTRAASTALVAVALVAAVWGLLHVGWYPHGQIVDYGVYQKYGDKIVHERAVPYRDFELEYPPAALPVFAAPALQDGDHDYRMAFQALMAGCFALAVLTVLALAGMRAAAAAALLPLALGSVVVSRFDFWPAALAVLAVGFALRRRPAASALFMGTAFAAKLWPALLVPVLAIHVARRDGTRAATRWLSGCVAVAALWFVPFVVLSPGGIAHSFHEQLARPLQIESLGAAILIAVHQLWNTPLGIESTYGSQNVVGPGTGAVATASTVVELVALVALYVAFRRTRADVSDALRYCAAAVTITIAFGKVFSPQFLIWLIPLVPLVRGRRGVAATGLLAVACVLTQLYFPSHYWDFALRFYALPSLVVLARDLVVVALAAVLAWPRLQHEMLGEHRARVEALERVRAQVD